MAMSKREGEISAAADGECIKLSYFIQGNSCNSNLQQVTYHRRSYRPVFKLSCM